MLAPILILIFGLFLIALGFKFRRGCLSVVLLSFGAGLMSFSATVFSTIMASVGDLPPIVAFIFLLLSFLLPVFGLIACFIVWLRRRREERLIRDFLH